MGLNQTPIDVFAAEPFGFIEEYERALLKPLYGNIAVRFVSLATLIKMKELAGRPQDKLDIDQLRLLLNNEH